MAYRANVPSARNRQRGRTSTTFIGRINGATVINRPRWSTPACKAGLIVFVQKVIERSARGRDGRNAVGFIGREPTARPTPDIGAQAPGQSSGLRALAAAPPDAPADQDPYLG